MNKAIDKLFVAIDYFTGILTGLMVLFVFLNVVLRTFFSSGLTWSEELARYLFVYVTYIGAISAMRANAHLGVDLLMSRVKPGMQMLLYIISQTLIAVMMCMLAYGAWGDGNAEYTRHNGSAADSILCFVLFRCVDGCFHCDSGSGKHYPCVEES